MPMPAPIPPKLQRHLIFVGSSRTMLLNAVAELLTDGGIASTLTLAGNGELRPELEMENFRRAIFFGCWIMCTN